MRHEPEIESATTTAIKTIARVNTEWATAVLGLNGKFDAMIALLERAERSEHSGATDELNIAALDRAEIKRGQIDLMNAFETHKRETFQMVKHYAPISTRLWNWIVEFITRRRQPFDGRWRV